MILQLNPPIPVASPRGSGICHALLDYGPEFTTLWLVADDETGQLWWVPQDKIRAQRNISMGRLSPEKPA